MESDETPIVRPTKLIVDGDSYKVSDLGQNQGWLPIFMENPNTHDEVTKLIERTIIEWQERQNEGVCGLSLARTIRDALDKASLLKKQKK